MIMDEVLDFVGEETFDWSPSSAEKLAWRLGLKLAATKGTRTTWRKGGTSLSAYRDGDALRKVEITFWVREPNEDEAQYRADLSALQAEYARRLDQAQRRLGKAVFEGTLDDAGAPADEDFVRMALWPQPWGRLMLKMLHEDRDVPLRVSLGLEK